MTHRHTISFDKYFRSFLLFCCFQRVRVTRDPWKPSHSTRMVGGPSQNSIPSFLTGLDLRKLIKPSGLDFLAYETHLGTNLAYKYLLKPPMSHICVDWVGTSALASSPPTPSSLFRTLPATTIARDARVSPLPLQACPRPAAFSITGLWPDADQRQESQLLNVGVPHPLSLLQQSSHYSSLTNLYRTY